MNDQLVSEAHNNIHIFYKYSWFVGVCFYCLCNISGHVSVFLNTKPRSKDWGICIK